MTSPLPAAFLCLTTLLVAACPPLPPEVACTTDAGPVAPPQQFTQRTLPDGGTLSSGWTFRMRLEPRTRPDGTGRTLSTNAVIASLDSVTLRNGAPLGQEWTVYATTRDGQPCCEPLPRIRLGPAGYFVPAQTFRLKAKTALRVQVPATPSMDYETLSDFEVKLLEDTPLADFGAGQPSVLPFSRGQAELREDFGAGLAADPALVAWSLELTR